MRYIITIILTCVFLFNSGCGKNSPVYTEQKIEATLQNGWKAYEKQNFSEAEEIFLKLKNSINIDEGKEARVGAAYSRISNFTENSLELQQNIEYIRVILEEVFENNINTLYEPVFNSNIDNADARALLSTIYLLQGNVALYNANLAESELNGNIDSTTQTMIDRLKGM